MKKVITLAALALVFSAHAFADEAILQANNQVSLSVGSHRLGYREPSQSASFPGDFDTEMGTQFTAGVSAVRQGTLFGINDIYTSASASFATGHTNYQGYLLANMTPKRDNTSNVFGDFQFRAGKAFSFGSRSQFQVVPYVQYAYHVWSRTIGTDASEVYSHHTLGGGILGQYAVNKKLVLSADVTVSEMFGAQMRKKPLPTFDVHERPVLQLGFGADYAITRNLHVSANYRFVKFNYGRSPDVQGNDGSSWYEPSSKSTENVVTVGLGYSF